MKKSLARKESEERLADWLLDGAAGLLFLLIVWLMFSGCASPPWRDRVFGPDYLPRNVYRENDRLPPTIKRVALLPLAFAQNDPLVETGRAQLEPVLCQELNRLGRFEVTPVTPEELKRLTGEPTWTTEEELPNDFFDKLRRTVGCDAVLFNQLTAYRPYQPMAVGWRFKLVDARTLRIRWAADQVFNAGEKKVINSARRYYQHHLRSPGLLADSQTILRSPLEFGQYAAHALLETLPER